MESSQQLYTQLLKSDPRSIDAHLGLADIASQQGDRDAASRHYVKVLELDPRNPLVRYVIARTPIDENAILLDASEVQHGLLGSGRYEVETDYLMFMPPGIGWLRGVDRALAWLPLGAQYAVAARKPA